jgi:uncharacterized membrane protein YhaH (DUF805 family)
MYELCRVDRRTMQLVPKFLSSSRDKATALGSLTILPLLIWWAGWYPAIMSSDSVDQWGQVLSFEFHNSHPITHTIYLWTVSLVWQSPAAVALVQIALFAVLMAFIARRLVDLGARMWMAVVTVWAIALLPMTGATAISIWKDVPFTLAMAWVFTELLLSARNRGRYWDRWQGPVRLGIGLGLMWALRANGKLTVLVFVIALAIGFRAHWRQVVLMATSVVGVGVVLPTLLLAVFPVTNQPIEPAQVFMPDVAAVVVHDRDALSQGDLALVTAVAPLAVWESQYDCGDSGPLVFHPEFDNAAIKRDPSTYRRLVVKALVGSPATVAGHRWCAGEYLLSPYNRTSTYVHRPPFDIWQNDLDLERAPLSDRAYDLTLWAYKVVERPRLEWLTWRPAIYVLLGLITYGAVWWRRRLWPLEWIGLFFVIHLGNVFATSPSHEFRYAFGLYLISLASAPLWYLIANPSLADIERES